MFYLNQSHKKIHRNDEKLEKYYIEYLLYI